MSDTPTTGDREQQRADNVESRRQSGLEPQPRDREEPPPADAVTDEDRKKETRQAERIQQSGEGIHGVSTQGREDQDAEDEVRSATEGRA